MVPVLLWPTGSPTMQITQSRRFFPEDDTITQPFHSLPPPVSPTRLGSQNVKIDLTYRIIFTAPGWKTEIPHERGIL
jgi:hypothetical protein